MFSMTRLNRAPGLADGPAVVLGKDPGELLGLGVEDLAHVKEHPGPLAQGDGFQPLETARGGLHRGPGLGLGGLGILGDDLLVKGVQNLPVITRLRLHPLVADEQLQPAVMLLDLFQNSHLCLS